MSFLQRRETMLHKEGFVFLIMASKRIVLWKGTMSMDKTWSWPPRDLHWMEEELL
jgi:hypothetical protein